MNRLMKPRTQTLRGRGGRVLTSLSLLRHGKETTLTRSIGGHSSLLRARGEGCGKTRLGDESFSCNESLLINNIASSLTFARLQGCSEGQLPKRLRRGLRQSRTNGSPKDPASGRSARG